MYSYTQTCTQKPTHIPTCTLAITYTHQHTFTCTKTYDTHTSTHPPTRKHPPIHAKIHIINHKFIRIHEHEAPEFNLRKQESNQTVYSNEFDACVLCV